MSIAIKVEELSKAYQLGQIGTGTVSRDIERWFAKLRGKEDPFLRIGETNNRAIMGTSDVVWSLKDINFEIESGEAVGIIGGNGAGKSTLLKILSKVTAPTTGHITGKGRIASLLEVGTGFHPELTGKENIYLNGAILGMRKKEIKRKFDEIVDFAGVGRYINTPVKRYSSGMYVRLAFAVAAHLESEILIVDEVLAVGDAEFQKKCLGKMSDVSKGEGRTVLFVSHNMGAIQNLCSKIIVLNQGEVAFSGATYQGIRHYLSSGINNERSVYEKTDTNLIDAIAKAKIVNEEGQLTKDFGFNDDIYVALRFNVSQNFKTAIISLRFIDNLDRIVFTTENDTSRFLSDSNQVNVKIKVPGHTLVPNKYKITIALHIPNVQMIDLLTDVLTFNVVETGSRFFHYGGSDIGCVYVDCEWSKND